MNMNELQVGDIFFDFNGDMRQVTQRIVMANGLVVIRSVVVEQPEDPQPEV